MRMFSEIESAVEQIENNGSLREEKDFLNRAEAIDFLDFQAIGALVKLQNEEGNTKEIADLKYRTEQVMEELEKVNDNLFLKLEENIRKEGLTVNQFKNLVGEYFDFNLYHGDQPEGPGYDNLDIFINRLFPFQYVPRQVFDLERGMVYYQKTPARIVLEFIGKIEFTKDDVFFDLGSGLGQLVILVNLLTGIKTRGVEIEPIFCDYARQSAAAFKLTDVIFTNADARTVDYSEGTVFFMYTPFTGEILENVLEVLRKESEVRKIKIITYGPCTTHVSSQSWLELSIPHDGNIYKPAIFSVSKLKAE
jgi:predicted RNA methylase